MLSFVPRPERSGIDASGPPSQRYQILGRFASGAMGQIFLARMRTVSGPGKEVALKRMRPELRLDRDSVEMFIDEASIAARMNHPNIVQIYELGELDGSMFIAMELVSGVNLLDLGKRLSVEQRSFPPDLAVKIGCDVLDALAYAHSYSDEGGRPLKIVHRDVSPQNIHLSFTGEVKLLDFGVSRAEGRLHKTHPGLMKGKLAFMAPEQIQGGAIDARADLFGLGAALYETLLGRHPFFGRTEAMVLRAIVEGRPTPPQDVDPSFPQGLGRILMRSLERDPAQRYSEAAEMRRELYAFAEAQGFDLSNRHLGLFLRNELQSRYEEERRARVMGNDELLVTALQGRVPGERGPSGARSASGSRPAENVKARPDSTPTTKIPLLPALGPGPRAIEPTGDLVPLQRSSMSALLADELADRPPPGKKDEERLGRFVLMRRLRQRGVTEAFLARQIGPGSFERLVEVEKLLPERARDYALSQAFVRVSTLMAGLGDPSLESILELHVEPEAYRVLEHRDGLYLDTVFERCRQLGVRLPTAGLCRIASHVSLALATLHTGRPSRRASIHRDVGPHQVQLLRQGQVVLGGLDHLRPIGVAVLAADEHRARPDCAPPESLSHALGAEGTATDLYGVGLILAEGLLLRPPFARSGWPATRRAILEEPFQALRPRREEIPERLVALIERLVARRPADRPDNALLLSRELESLIFEMGRPYSSADLATWMAENMPFIGA